MFSISCYNYYKTKILYCLAGQHQMQVDTQLQAAMQQKKNKKHKIKKYVTLNRQIDKKNLSKLSSVVLILRLLLCP